jgi:hypothetical protein
MSETSPLNGTMPHGVAPDAPAGTPIGADIVDLAKLRLPQDFAATLGVKKALLHVPVRKPDRHWFIRVHPDPAYRLDCFIIELKDENEAYIVLNDIYSYVAEEAVAKTIFTAINRSGTPFLWPIRLPGPDGRQDDWNKTAHAAAELAMTKWLRVASDRTAGCYQIFEATAANLSEPEWPAEPFAHLLKIAFKDRLIDTLDHPVLRRLRGEL